MTITAAAANGAATTSAMASENSKPDGPPMPVDPTTLEAANWWYDLSARWLLVAGVLASFAACATVALAFIQWQASIVREQHAEWRTSALENEAAQARRETAEASERIAGLQTEAERLRARSEADRLARTKIEEKLAPRSISGTNRLIIATAVAKYAPQKFEFIIYRDDQEVLHLAGAINGTLKAAGWIEEPSQSFMLAQLEIGVKVEFVPERAEEFGPAAHALGDALNASGISTTVDVRSGHSRPDRIFIRVGKKP